MLKSEYHPLKKILLKYPGDEVQNVLPFGEIDSPYSHNNTILPEIKNEYSEFTQILENEGVEIFYVEKLLDNQINLMSKNEKKKMLKVIFPSNYNKIIKKIGNQLEFDAGMLYGANTDVLDLIEPKAWAYFMRDPFVMTDKGIILSNFVNFDRKGETPLLKTLFENQLDKYDIAFDAPKENVFFQGGDIIIKDEETILLGLNNLTSKKAAKKIAKEMDVDVIGVYLPASPSVKKGYKDYSHLNLKFLHLDTLFNLLNEKYHVVCPFVFEKEHQYSNPVTGIFEKIKKTLKSKEKKEQISFFIGELKKTGSLTQFKFGSGEEKKLNLKLVDYMIEQGSEPIFVGGEPSKSSVFTAINELGWQGANTLSLNANKVVSFPFGKSTIGSIKKRGIDAIEIDAPQIMFDQGGPHCLSGALERY